MNPTPTTLSTLQSDILTAGTRLQSHLIETPLRRARKIGRRANCSLWLKCEHLQHTGSFKLRGALNKILSLDKDELAAGVVTASPGNHGLAVAHASRSLGTHAVVFVPQGAAAKNGELIEALGATLLCHGTDSDETEAHARVFAETHGLTYIPSYNDPAVIAGQGTIASELLRQSRGLDIVYIAVGGGGLLAGVAAGLAAAWPNTEVVACSPVASAVMIESLAAGRILDLPSSATWSDGTAGGLEVDTITFRLCQQVVSRSIRVEEPAILDGVRTLREELGLNVEGAAGVAAAAMLADQERRPGARAGVVVCGGNASQDLLDAL